VPVVGHQVFEKGRSPGGRGDQLLEPRAQVNVTMRWRPQDGSASRDAQYGRGGEASPPPETRSPLCRRALVEALRSERLQVGGRGTPQTRPLYAGREPASRARTRIMTTIVGRRGRRRYGVGSRLGRDVARPRPRGVVAEPASDVRRASRPARTRSPRGPVRSRRGAGPDADRAGITVERAGSVVRGPDGCPGAGCPRAPAPGAPIALTGQRGGPPPVPAAAPVVGWERRAGGSLARAAAGARAPRH